MNENNSRNDIIKVPAINATMVVLIIVGIIQLRISPKMVKQETVIIGYPTIRYKYSSAEI